MTLHLVNIRAMHQACRYAIKKESDGPDDKLYDPQVTGCQVTDLPSQCS